MLEPHRRFIIHVLMITYIMKSNHTIPCICHSSTQNKFVQRIFKNPNRDKHKLIKLVTLTCSDSHINQMIYSFAAKTTKNSLQKCQAA